MKFAGLIITGTTGAGQEAAAQKLAALDQRFETVQAVSAGKATEADGVWGCRLVTQAEFDKMVSTSALLAQSVNEGNQYAVVREAVEGTASRGKVPVLVCPPRLACAVKMAYLTFFLDEPDSDLDRVLKAALLQTPKYGKQRTLDRQSRNLFTYCLHGAELTASVDLMRSVWEYRETGGALPKRLIELMMRCGTLVRDGDRNGITGAAYDLHLGSVCYYGGKSRSLTEQSPFLKLDPYEYAIVTSKETMDFPLDVVGRFDLSVGMFCQGVILSNGVQVDPGFRGPLLCLLFNTSSDVVQLKLGQHYATIEFTKLVEPTEGYTGPHQDKKNLMDYLSKQVSRSPISDLRKDIDSLKREKWWSKTLPLLISLAAALAGIAGLVIALTRPTGQ